MRRKLLLSMLLATSVSLCAQINVFRQGFEDDEVITDPTALAYPDYVNFGEDEEGNPLGNRYEIADYASFTGEKSLYVQNDNTLGGWNSALKFRNLPIKANTSYRVTYYAITTVGASLRTRMLCGVEKSDVPFVGVGNVAYDDVYTGFDSENWRKHVVMFYYTSDEIQQAYYLTQSGKEEPTLPEDKYFLNLNMYSEGEYYIDEISLDESSIAGITYAVDALRVNFGYKTDFSAASKAPVVLDRSSATVIIDGKEAEIESVELKSDGYMYIYLEDMIDSGSNVVVSFTNPKGEDGPKYSSTEALRPNSWDENDELYVLDFVAEVAEEDTDSEADYGFSNLYDTPVLLVAEPETGSFDLPKNTDTFTLTFNKLVNLNEVEAKLANDEFSEDLVLKTEGEFASTLVFARTSATELETATYYLEVTNIQPEKYIEGLIEPGQVEIKLSFGVVDAGGVDPVTEIFVEDFGAFEKDGIVPVGWKTTNGYGDDEDKNVNIGPIDGGAQNSRVMGPFTGASRSWDYAMYVRHGAGGTAYCSYGGISEAEAAEKGIEAEDIPRLSLEAGTYELFYDCGQWSRQGSTLKFDVLVYALEDGAEVASEVNIVVTEPYIAENKGISFNATTKSLSFDIKKPGNYVVKFVENSSDGYTGLLLSNVKVNKIANIPGAKEKSDLATALAAAEKAYATVCDVESGNVIDIYEDEATTAALKTVIDRAKSFASTSPSEYGKITAELAGKTELVNVHKINVDNYYSYLNLAGEALELYKGTRYEALKYYPVLEDVYSRYKDVMLTDDATLTEVNTTLLKNANTLTNMAEFGVGLLTERLSRLIDLAEILEVDINDELMIAASESLTDNALLAKQLSWKCTDQLYAKFLEGVDFFTGEFEGETLSLDMSGYIKNPEMYVLVDAVSDGLSTAPNMKIGTLSSFCPGWSDEGSINGYGDLTIHQSNNNQGGADLFQTGYSEVVDAIVKTWASEFNIHQEVTGLPVGTYRLYTRSSNQDGDTEDNPLTVKCNQSVYAIVDGDSIGAAWNPDAGQWFGSGRKEYTSYVDFEVKDVKSVVKIGIYSDTRSNGTNTFFNALNLFMTGKDNTFDYASSIGEDVITTPKEIKEINYYSINGMLLNQAQKGLNIQRITYTDGTVKVRKYFKK